MAIQINNFLNSPEPVREPSFDSLTQSGILCNSSYFAAVFTTTVPTALTASGVQTVTPSAMSGLNKNGYWQIRVGSVLTIANNSTFSSGYEQVVVTAATLTTFTANFSQAHNVSPWYILGTNFNLAKDATLPDGSGPLGIQAISPYYYNGNSFDNARSGLNGVVASATGFPNILPMTQYNSTAPTLANSNWTNLQCDANGNLKVNAGVVSLTLNPTAPALTTSSTQILAAKPTRNYLFLQNNDSTQTVWIGFGTAATTAAPSLRLTPGSSFQMQNVITSQAVFALATAGTSALTVLEG